MCKYYIGESKPLDAVNLYEVLVFNTDKDAERIKSRSDLTREAVHRFIDRNYQSDPKLIAEAVGRFEPESKEKTQVTQAQINEKTQAKSAVVRDALKRYY